MTAVVSRWLDNPGSPVQIVVSWTLNVLAILFLVLTLLFAQDVIFGKGFGPYRDKPKAVCRSYRPCYAKQEKFLWIIPWVT